jgi:hypothetical protein
LPFLVGTSRFRSGIALASTPRLVDDATHWAAYWKPVST